jgi:hypothetical protein
LFGEIVVSDGIEKRPSSMCRRSPRALCHRARAPPDDDELSDVVNEPLTDGRRQVAFCDQRINLIEP